MNDVLITEFPDVNEEGLKRWSLGDLKHGTVKVFVFEKPRTEVMDDTARFLVRTFDHEGNCLSEHFFKRRFILHRYISRLFNVRGVQLSEAEVTCEQEVEA